MTEKFEELFSDPLPRERMRVLLLAFPWVAKELFADYRITARYEWGTNLHEDLQYCTMKINIDWFEDFVEKSLEQAIVKPGHSDFRFSINDGKLEILFCHESDIHLRGNDPQLVQRFMATLPFSSIRFRTKNQIKQDYPDSIREPQFMIETSSQATDYKGDIGAS